MILRSKLRVRARGGPAYPPLCHRRVVSCVLPTSRRLSGSGSETDLPEPSPIDVSIQGVRSELQAPHVFSGGTETAHAIAVLDEGNTGLPEVLDSAFSKKRYSESATATGLRVVSGRAQTAHANAGKSKGIIGLLESDFSKNRAGNSTVVKSVAGHASPSSLHATAGERSGVIGLLEVIESDFPSLSNSVNSCLVLSTSACARVCRAARAVASACVCLVASSSAESAAVAHAHATTLYDACNSGELVVFCQCRGPPATVWVERPTRRKGSKGGVSGLAEDLRLVSEVEAGANCRPDGCVRGQVAGSLPGRQPGTGTMQVRGGAVTPSLHPDFPCTHARARKLLDNLEHLRVEWRPRGTYEAWVTPGHDCLCSYAYGRGAAVRPQTEDAIWRGVIGLWGRVAPLLSPWCARREYANGSELEPVRRFKIMHPLA